MKYKYLIFTLLFAFTISCTTRIEQATEIIDYPNITPDYIDVTIPYNIAPLNFSVNNTSDATQLVIANKTDEIRVRSKNGRLKIPLSKWKKLLLNAKGDSLTFTVSIKKADEWLTYKPFHMAVTPDPVDPYIAFRLIPPGYELWSKMGIYQRNLENYQRTAIYENSLTKENCVNCHSFPMQNPDKMLFHMRQTYPGTILIDNGKIEKLNTKTDQTLSALVYPSWHPSGNFIAFSVNKTLQLFHQNHQERIEVYDMSSDVVVYDVKKHEIITTPYIFSKGIFETFPTFSPDGKTLFFCTADSVEMPKDYQQVRYSLCSISFDPDSRTFGSKTDTLFNAKIMNKSVSFPRVSPDGKFLVFTLSDYGNFSIWHKSADLWLYDLATNESRPLNEINSRDVESYHSWSSNSRWLVFSSRRMDGLYTRPYFAHIDSNGNAGKPFLLPQRDNDFYKDFLFSYNIPEFITGKINVSKRKIADKAKKDKGIDVTFNQSK